jgi:allantoinase
VTFDIVVAGVALVGRPPRPAHVEVGIRDGRVAEVAPLGSGLAGRECLRLADDEVLLPGLVDTHVHVNEPGRTEWEGFASATRAAAAGGVTTILDMPPNLIPPTLDPDALAVKRAAAAGQSSIHVGFWGGVTPANLGSLRALHDAGVFGFKCFLAPSGVDEFAHLDAAGLAAAAGEIAAFGGLLIVHAEDPGILESASAPRGGDYPAYVASRPDAAETVAIEGVIAEVRRTGVRAHILHLSSTASLPALRAARAEGLPITVETCPHYLSLDAGVVPEGGTHFKCAPPIRDVANRDA